MKIAGVIHLYLSIYLSTFLALTFSLPVSPIPSPSSSPLTPVALPFPTARPAAPASARRVPSPPPCMLDGPLVSQGCRRRPGSRAGVWVDACLASCTLASNKALDIEFPSVLTLCG